MPTPKNEQPHTVEVHVEFNVYDAKNKAVAVESALAALDRINDIKLDDDTIVRVEAPTLLR